ncbi:hypothetical protein XH99_18665 [Bradyrhizobium nanningense]|uniref:Uncharacterized protein n=1 Tax=Bradyrhizobium nanningense TaxID=1325118 RepID=A0A4Q0S4K8_9BRAD|nr:hypothetical protein [Bradyrhizobium nanningense]RXH26792.1 hypothetical protein XH99_18665 [Bradyrhizobium nanningense]RXH27950.1 hypothetical protein XH84_27150 [Bradyrhizobium nanningense]
MDDREFFTKLASLDRGIADRWKRATGGRLSARVGEKAVEAIVIPVLLTKKVTASQAQALAMVFHTEGLNTEARIFMVTAIIAAYDNDIFFAGSAKPLITRDDLQPIDAALGMANVGKIHFTSPGTGMTYAPDLYNAIRGLIYAGKIRVFEADAALLLTRLGNYRGDLNRIVLYKGAAPAARAEMIVHEVTHAIQDWRNLDSTVKFIEADAYIAGAVAALGANPDYSFLEYKAEQTAAKELILDGSAARMDRAWTEAYANLVKRIEATPTYRATSNLKFGGADKKGRADKATLFKDALAYFKADNIFAAAVDDFYQMGSDASKYVKRLLALGGK